MPAFVDLFGALLRRAVTAGDRARLPRFAGDLALPGLAAPVEVLRDRWGIPHIYASSAADAYRAQGYIHAQERLWQMDLLRRLACGRLSEVFGEIALDTDRAARTFGFARLGEVDLAQADAAIVAGLTAYAEGVNAFLAGPDGRRRPPEFALLRYRPGPWRPADTAAIARLQLWELSHAWYGEIVRAQIIAAVGAERAAEIDVQYPPANPITLPAGIEFHRLGQGGILQAAQGPFLARGLGSNEFAVCGQRTATGHPLLANDMHLGLSAPGLWHLIHLDAGDLQVSGASLPGVPGITVGHNDRIAWGMTLAFTDCEDLFIERFDPADPTRYQFRDEWRLADVVEEVIGVRGRAAPHVERVIITHHGPVLADVVDGAVAGEPGQRLAVQSMALRPSKALGGFMVLTRARGWDDFVEAMRLIDGTQLSVAYADVEGNIGYWVTGDVPVRAAGDGRTPVPGWTGEAEWIGVVPFAEMPHALNPAAGYIVNCNNRVVGDAYPHNLGNAWLNGYRARRITDLLAGNARVSIDDCRAIQMDVTTVAGRELAARLGRFVAGEPRLDAALALLRAWDGALTADSAAGAIYEALRYHLVRNLVEPALGPDLAVRWLGRGFDPALYSGSELYGWDMPTVLRLLDKASPGEATDSWWVQNAGGRDAWVRRSLAAAVADLERALGPDMDRWQWGRLHRTYFPHALGAQPLLDRVFSRGPYATGGDADTPNMSAISAGRPYDNHGAAPTFRQIVDLGDLSRSLVMAPPGQSGRLGSRHYDDLIAPWLVGEYIPMLWTRAQVEAETHSRMRMRPGG